MASRRGSCCIVPGCSLRSGTNLLSKVRTFTFPAEEERRNAWIAAVKRDNWRPSKGSRICSAHFIQGIELGQSCSRHENCEANDNNSYCRHSICRCKPFFRRVLVLSENVTRCRTGSEPRESCYNVEDCGGSNATCHEGLCRCREGFYKDEETDDCRPRRYLDETCARDSDCESLVNNSYCSGDRCECKNGYIREGALPEDQHCEIDRGGRGALKILFALMLPVVVCAFVYLYRNRKVNQANKNQPGEDDQRSSPAPQGTYSTDTGVKSPLVDTPLSPMPPDIITGSPIEVRTTMAMDMRGKPPCTFSIMV